MMWPACMACMNNSKKHIKVQLTNLSAEVLNSLRQFKPMKQLKKMLPGVQKRVSL